MTDTTSTANRCWTHYDRHGFPTFDLTEERARYLKSIVGGSIHKSDPARAEAIREALRKARG